MSIDFKLLNNSPVVTSYLPVVKKEHQIFDVVFKQTTGIDAYDACKIARTNMRPQDLMILWKGTEVVFEYNGSTYEIKFHPGFIFDGASVPKPLVRGDLNKFGQAVELASIVHDLLFNQKLLPFEDANNVFEGLLKSTGLLSKFTIGLYMLGVRSFVGRKIYNEGKPEESWLKGYYTWTKLW